MITFIKIKPGEKVRSTQTIPRQVCTYTKNMLYRSTVWPPSVIYYLRSGPGGQLRQITNAENIEFYE